MKQKKLRRFWVSWWSKEEPKKTPFQYWVSGSRGWTELEWSICAVLDAPSPKKLWEAVERFFPDCEKRFCEEKDRDFNLTNSDRFPDFCNRTSIG